MLPGLFYCRNFVCTLVRPSASRGALGEAEHRGYGGKPRTRKPMLDDKPLSDRSPPLDPVVVEGNQDGTLFDHRRAVGPPPLFVVGCFAAITHGADLGHPPG